MAEDLSKTQTGGEGKTEQTVQPETPNNQQLKVDNAPLPSSKPVDISSDLPTEPVKVEGLDSGTDNPKDDLLKREGETQVEGLEETPVDEALTSFPKDNMVLTRPYPEFKDEYEDSDLVKKIKSDVNLELEGDVDSDVGVIDFNPEIKNDPLKTIELNDLEFNNDLDNTVNSVENPQIKTDKGPNLNLNTEEINTDSNIPPPKRDGFYDNENGTVSTHKMRAEQLEDKSWVAFPSLFQNEDGSWVDMSKEAEVNWINTYKEAEKRGEVILFGNDKQKALDYGEGSWKSDDYYESQVSREKTKNLNTLKISDETDTFFNQELKRQQAEDKQKEFLQTSSLIEGDIKKSKKAKSTTPLSSKEALTSSKIFTNGFSNEMDPFFYVPEDQRLNLHEKSGLFKKKLFINPLSTQGNNQNLRIIGNGDIKRGKTLMRAFKEFYITDKELERYKKNFPGSNDRNYINSKYMDLIVDLDITEQEFSQFKSLIQGATKWKTDNVDGVKKKVKLPSGSLYNFTFKPSNSSREFSINIDDFKESEIQDFEDVGITNTFENSWKSLNVSNKQLNYIASYYKKNNKNFSKGVFREQQKLARELDENGVPFYNETGDIWNHGLNGDGSSKAYKDALKRYRDFKIKQRADFYGNPGDGKGRKLNKKEKELLFSDKLPKDFKWDQASSVSDVREMAIRSGVKDNKMEMKEVNKRASDLFLTNGRLASSEEIESRLPKLFPGFTISSSSNRFFSRSASDVTLVSPTGRTYSFENLDKNLNGNVQEFLFQNQNSHLDNIEDEWLHRFDRNSWNIRNGSKSQSESYTISLNYKRQAQSRSGRGYIGTKADKFIKTDKPQEYIIDKEGRNADLINYALEQDLKEYEGFSKKFDGYRSEWDELSKNPTERLEKAKKAYEKNADRFKYKKSQILEDNKGNPDRANMLIGQLNSSFIKSKNDYVNAANSYNKLLEDNKDLLGNLKKTGEWLDANGTVLRKNMLLFEKTIALNESVSKNTATSNPFVATASGIVSGFTKVYSGIMAFGTDVVIEGVKLFGGVSQKEAGDYLKSYLAVTDQGPGASAADFLGFDYTNPESVQQQVLDLHETFTDYLDITITPQGLSDMSDYMQAIYAVSESVGAMFFPMPIKGGVGKLFKNSKGVKMVKIGEKVVPFKSLKFGQRAAINAKSRLHLNANMTSMMYSNYRRELESTDELQNVSNFQKNIFAVPTALFVGALENLGMKSMNLASGVGNKMMNRVFNNVLKKNPKTSKQFYGLIQSESEALLANGLFKISGGMLTEGITEAGQVLPEVGMREVFNAMTGSDLLSNPETMEELAGMMGENFKLGAYGASAMTSVSGGVGFMLEQMRGNKADKYVFSNENYQVLKETLDKNEGKKLKEYYVEAYRSGDMSRDDARGHIEAVNKIITIEKQINELVPDIKGSERKKLVDLFVEKTRLQATSEQVEDKSLLNKLIGDIQNEIVSTVDNFNKKEKAPVTETVEADQDTKAEEGDKDVTVEKEGPKTKKQKVFSEVLGREVEREVPVETAAPEVKTEEETTESLNVSTKINQEKSDRLGGEARDIIVDGKVVGTVMGNENASGDFEVQDVDVDESLQGQGIGTQVYEQLNKEKKGQKVVSSGAFVENEAGVKPGEKLWNKLVKERKAIKNEKGGFEMVETPVETKEETVVPEATKEVVEDLKVTPDEEASGVIQKVKGEQNETLNTEVEVSEKDTKDGKQVTKNYKNYKTEDGSKTEVGKGYYETTLGEIRDKLGDSDKEFFEDDNDSTPVRVSSETQVEGGDVTSNISYKTGTSRYADFTGRSVKSSESLVVAPTVTETKADTKQEDRPLKKTIKDKVDQIANPKDGAGFANPWFNSSIIDRAEIKNDADLKEYYIQSLESGDPSYLDEGSKDFYEGEFKRLGINPDKVNVTKNPSENVKFLQEQFEKRKQDAKLKEGQKQQEKVVSKDIAKVKKAELDQKVNTEIDKTVNLKSIKDKKGKQLTSALDTRIRKLKAQKVKAKTKAKKQDIDAKIKAAQAIKRSPSKFVGKTKPVKTKAVKTEPKTKTPVKKDISKGELTIEGVGNKGFETFVGKSYEKRRGPKDSPLGDTRKVKRGFELYETITDGKKVFTLQQYTPDRLGRSGHYNISLAFPADSDITIGDVSGELLGINRDIKNSVKTNEKNPNLLSLLGGTKRRLEAIVEKRKQSKLDNNESLMFSAKVKKQVDESIDEGVDNETIKEEIIKEIDENNDLPRQFDVGRNISTKNKINVKKHSNRRNPDGSKSLVGKVNTITNEDLKKFEGLPMVFNISDQLRTGAVKSFTGKIIDRLFGGLFFSHTKGHRNAAWASIDYVTAQRKIKSAKELYIRNKEIFDKAWADGILPDGHIPMPIVKMGDSSIRSNEAVFRVGLENLNVLPLSTKIGATEVLRKDLVDIIEKRKDQIKNPEKTLGKKWAEKSADKKKDYIKLKQKDISYAEAIINEIDNGDHKGDIVKVTENIVNNPKMSLKVRNMLENRLFYGEPDTSMGPPGSIVGKFIEKSSPTVNVNGKQVSSRSLMHRSQIVRTIEEPALADIPPGHIIAMSSIDIKTENQQGKTTDPTVREGGVIETNHPNYSAGIKGKFLGVLENPIHVKDAFSEVYGSVVEQIIRVDEKSTGFESVSEAERLGVPVAMGLSNNNLYGAVLSLKRNQLDELNSFLRQAFPNVFFFNNQTAWDAVKKKEGFIQKTDSGNNVIYGVFSGKDGAVYLNPDEATFGTAIHEAGHVWSSFCKKNNPNLWDKGVELAKKTNLYKDIEKQNPDLNTEQIAEEVLAEMIESKGEKIVENSLNKQAKNWLLDLWRFVKSKFKSLMNVTEDSEIQNITIGQFTDGMLADIMAGTPMPITGKKGTVLFENKEITAKLKEAELMFSAKKNDRIPTNLYNKLFKSEKPAITLTDRNGDTVKKIVEERKVYDSKFGEQLTVKFKNDPKKYFYSKERGEFMSPGAATSIFKISEKDSKSQGKRLDPTKQTKKPVDTKRKKKKTEPVKTEKKVSKPKEKITDKNVNEKLQNIVNKSNQIEKMNQEEIQDYKDELVSFINYAFKGLKSDPKERAALLNKVARVRTQKQLNFHVAMVKRRAATRLKTEIKNSFTKKNLFTKVRGSKNFRGKATITAIKELRSLNLDGLAQMSFEETLALKTQIDNIIQGGKADLKLLTEIERRASRRDKGVVNKAIRKDVYAKYDKIEDIVNFLENNPKSYVILDGELMRMSRFNNWLEANGERASEWETIFKERSPVLAYQQDRTVDVKEAEKQGVKRNLFKSFKQGLSYVLTYSTADIEMTNKKIINATNDKALKAFLDDKIMHDVKYGELNKLEGASARIKSLQSKQMEALGFDNKNQLQSFLNDIVSRKVDVDLFNEKKSVIQKSLTLTSGHALNNYLMLQNSEGNIKDQLENQGINTKALTEYIEGDSDLKAYAETMLDWYNNEGKDQYSYLFEKIYNVPISDGIYYPTSRKVQQSGDQAINMDDNSFKPVTAVTSNLKQKVDNPQADLDIYGDPQQFFVDYVSNMEHTKAYIDLAKNAQNLFSEENINSLINILGQKRYNAYKNHLNRIISGQNPFTTNRGQLDSIANSITNYNTITSLFFRTKGVVQQSTSFMNYAGAGLKYGIAPTEILFGVTFNKDGKFSPKYKSYYFSEEGKALATKIWQSEYRKHRTSGGGALEVEAKRLLDGYVNGTTPLDKVKSALIKTGMSPITAGDILASTAMPGGGFAFAFALYNKSRKEGMSKEAAADFAYKEWAVTTEETQQYNLREDLKSEAVYSSIARIFMPFRSTQISYARKFQKAALTLYNYTKKRKDSVYSKDELAEAAWDFMYYPFAANIMFQLVSSGIGKALMFGDDDDDKIVETDPLKLSEEKITKSELTKRYLYMTSMDLIQSFAQGFGYAGLASDMTLNAMRGRFLKSSGSPTLDMFLSMVKVISSVPDAMTRKEDNPMKTLDQINKKARLNKIKSGKDKGQTLEEIIDEHDKKALAYNVGTGNIFQDLISWGSMTYDQKAAWKKVFAVKNIDKMIDRTIELKDTGITASSLWDFAADPYDLSEDSYLFKNQDQIWRRGAYKIFKGDKDFRMGKSKGVDYITIPVKKKSKSGTGKSRRGKSRSRSRRRKGR